MLWLWLWHARWGQDQDQLPGVGVLKWNVLRALTAHKAAHGHRGRKRTIVHCYVLIIRTYNAQQSHVVLKIQPKWHRLAGLLDRLILQTIGASEAPHPA